jgi:ankyrin repeat protein
MLAVFDESNNGNAAWHSDARAFIIAAIQSDGSPATNESLSQQGKSLLAGGCDDPVVLYLVAICALPDEEKERAAGLLERAGRAISEKPGHDLINFFVCRDGYLVIRELKGWREAWPWFAFARESMCAAVTGGTVDAEGAQIAYRCLIDLGDRGWNSNKDYWGVIRQKLGEAPDKVDPWFSKMIEGESEIQLAWEARGGGYANTVSGQGWKGFAEHSELARRALETAWSMHPERPEAAARLVYVSLGQGDSYQTVARSWFDRATAAQIDYAPAYTLYLWGLRPRWYGSPEEMVAFGLECLDGGRFDTWVPMFYLRTLRDAGSEFPGGQWRHVFRQPGVADNLKRLFDGYRKAPEYETDEGRLLAAEALAMMWCGHYSEASPLWSRVPADLDMSMGFWGGSLAFRSRPRAMIEAELRGFNGPMRDTLLVAEEAELAGREKDAIKLYTEVMQAAGDDSGLRDYARDRAAIIMINDGDGKPIYWIEGDNLLNAAAQYDNLDAATFLIANGRDASSQGEGGTTALHAAAKDGRIRMIEYLLMAGASIDAADRDGHTPLGIALAHNQPAVADLLKEKGASASASPDPASSGRLLFDAVSRGQVDLVKEMLEQGVAVDQKLTDGGFTALMIAVQKEDERMTVLLLERGADPNVGDGSARTALHLAASRNNPVVVGLLLQHHADPLVKDTSGRTPMAQAVSLQFVEVADALLAAGAKADTDVVKDWPMLHFAISKKDKRLVDVVLRGGAAIDQDHRQNGSPLGLALRFDDPEMALHLLDRGADPGLRDHWGWCPIHYASVAGMGEVLGRLVEKGADVNAPAENKMWALQMALLAGNPENVALLLDHGADVSSLWKGDWGDPTNYYSKRFKTKCVPLLEAGAKTATKAVPMASESADRAAMLVVLERSDAWRRWVGSGGSAVESGPTGAESSTPSLHQ